MKALAALPLIFVAATAPAFPEESGRLALREALELAQSRNLDLVAARRRRAVSSAGIRAAGQRPNPTLNFAALRDTPHEGLFFVQPLELGGKRSRRIEVARQESGLTEVEITVLEREVRRNTREAFYGLTLARAETGRLKRVVQLAERLKQIAQERFEAGAVPRLEVIQAELALARAQADLQIAGQRENVSLSQLNALLNEPPTRPWELATPLEELPPAFTLQDLLERAYQANPELQRLDQELKVERSREKLLKAERIPNLEVELGADFNAPHDFAVGPRSQLSFALPIFSRNQGQIAQSLASQRVLEGDVAATRRAVAGRVEFRYLDLTSRETQVELYHQRLLPATRQLESMAEESYHAGKANILTVLDAQRSAQDLERDYLESLFESHSAFAMLEETVGAPLP